MRLLWVSNYSSQSGYANQARMWVKRIQDAGHHTTVFELANGARLPVLVDGVQVLPTGLDPLGSDILLQHAQAMRSHAVMTLIDAWGMNKDVMQQVAWYPMTPVDTQPVAPHVVEALKSCQRPIAYAQYGWKELKKEGFDPLYWPHGVDPTVWFPRDKTEARKRVGLEDGRFVASFVGVNDSAVISRKGIPELLMAWQMFSSMHPDALLYLHTSMHGNLPVAQYGGVRIDIILKTLGINPATVRVVDQYRYRTGIPASELADVIAASDVFVLPTTGEGFGLPMLEAQRVGTPIITTNCCTGPELCFGGWLIGGEPAWSWQDCVITKPGIADLVDALVAAKEERNDPERRKMAIEGAKEYDVDYVFSKYGVPTLNAIAEHVLDMLQLSA